ncbi:MAG: low molecular weight phosphatase family protein [Candidatus Roseilinea sp.]|nr:MAG: low molecular weight phosphatase family protein [Candidatus Roseilinea sp.]
MSDHTVLFVCTGNYYRSRYAELYFNATAPAHLGWRAASRGFAPNPFNPGPIAVSVIYRAQERGLPLPADLPHPRRLTEADLHSAQRIIALDEDEHRSYVEHYFPAWRNRITYWRVHDLHLMPTAEAFALIEHNVDALVRELTAITPAQPEYPR